MHVFKGEKSQGAKGGASRKLWHALHAVDKYLKGQAAWLVNYADRFRAGLELLKHPAPGRIGQRLEGVLVGDTTVSHDLR